MRNLFVLVTLFLGITFSSFSQNNISLAFSSVKGKIVFDTKGTFTTNFTVNGLKSEAEVKNFKSTVMAIKNVKSFDVFDTGSKNGERKATLVLLNNEEENMANLLKSLPFNSLTVDGKSYTKDQYEQIKSDLKAKKEAQKRMDARPKK